MKKEGKRQKAKGKSKGLIFVISGPSGSGKTTLAKKLLTRRSLKGKIFKSVSLTTRPKRSGERDGADYYFISERAFRAGIRKGKILEWTRFLGYYYGTLKAFVDAEIIKGRHLELCLDFNGARAIKKFYPKNTVTIFVLPPPLKELASRIKGRCSKIGEDEVRQRLRLAAQELTNRAFYDYRVKNINLDEAVRRLEEVVLKEITSRDSGG